MNERVANDKLVIIILRAHETKSKYEASGSTDLDYGPRNHEESCLGKVKPPPTANLPSLLIIKSVYLFLENDYVCLFGNNNLPITK